MGLSTNNKEHHHDKYITQWDGLWILLSAVLCALLVGGVFSEEKAHLEERLDTLEALHVQELEP